MYLTLFATIRALFRGLIIFPRFLSFFFAIGGVRVHIGFAVRGVCLLYLVANYYLVYGTATSYFFASAYSYRYFKRLWGGAPSYGEAGSSSLCRLLRCANLYPSPYIFYYILVLYIVTQTIIPYLFVTSGSLCLPVCIPYGKKGPSILAW